MANANKLMAGEESMGAVHIVELAKKKGFRAESHQQCSAGEICSHSPVAGAFTIMWMYSLGGLFEKILKRLSVGSNFSANFKRLSPRDPIRSARVFAGLAAIGLESLG